VDRKQLSLGNVHDDAERPLSAIHTAIFAALQLRRKRCHEDAGQPRAKLSQVHNPSNKDKSHKTQPQICNILLDPRSWHTETFGPTRLIQPDPTHPRLIEDH
jgi:hypothetical protein